MTERPLYPDALLSDVVRKIENSRRRIAVVVSSDGRLLGTLTDGDVRRCLLGGGTLQTPAVEAMNHNPITAEVGSPTGYLMDLMKRGNVMSIPIVTSEGHFVRIIHLNDLDLEEKEISKETGFEIAVIMAGGEGKRLHPVTKTIPKPMIKICGTPLIERQVLRLAKAGIKQIYISLNYLSQIIEDHFGDGSAFGIRICYLHESNKLGTAGALSLLPKQLQRPIIVINGDILTTSDFISLYAYHKDNNAVVTVAAVDYRVNIPYGVIRAYGSSVTGLEEKPSQRFLCNAGIYAMSPDAIDLIPSETYYNMTDLIGDCLTNNLEVAVFPVHEYWSDIGTHDDLKKARAVFSNISKLHD
jgi:dTDP-glucose pyrophosphorylase